jgi:hypothetical protein
MRIYLRGPAASTGASSIFVCQESLRSKAESDGVARFFHAQVQEVSNCPLRSQATFVQNRKFLYIKLPGAKDKSLRLACVSKDGKYAFLYWQSKE